MNRLLHYCTLAIALSNPFVAVASEEGVLRLGTFQIASPDLGQFGPVVVSGELDTTNQWGQTRLIFDRINRA